MPKKYVVLIYAAAAVLAVFLTVKYILPIMVPFIVALIFSVVMEPLIRVLQHRARFSRGMATLAAMALMFGGIGFVSAVVILKLVTELVHLSVSLPVIAAELRIYFQDLIDQATVFYINLPPHVATSLEQNINSLTQNLQALITTAVNSILNFISLVPGTLVVLVVSLLATFFVARDRHLIVQLLLRVTPASSRDKLLQVVREIVAAFVGYTRAQAILIFMTTLISITGLYLIGAEYALTMGLIIGLFDLIPVLGPATVYLPWAAWSFATGAAGFGLKLTVLYVLIFVARQLFETKIVSVNLGLHPLATLVAMYTGLKLLGFLGLVLGPVLLIAVQAALKAGVLDIKFNK